MQIDLLRTSGDIYRYSGYMPREAFEGYDEPVNIDMEPEEALKLLLAAEPNSDAIEPVLDN